MILWLQDEWTHRPDGEREISSRGHVTQTSCEVTNGKDDQKRDARERELGVEGTPQAFALIAHLLATHPCEYSRTARHLLFLQVHVHVHPI